MSTKKDDSATAVLDAQQEQTPEKDTPSQKRGSATQETETKGAETKGTETKGTQQPQPASGQPVETSMTINDSNITACYANFCRVSSTPEELILDLGLNPRPMDATNTSIDVSQRIILNHYTAKRLLSALSMALQRHEQVFGVLETDIRKRVQSR